MAIRLHTESAPMCVWMSAGVLNYKLCDRCFDCEHCALDAALRGAPQPAATEGNAAIVEGPRRREYPADCLYADGHTWLRPLELHEHRYRMGLDCFAATMIGSPMHVGWNRAPHVSAGTVICVLQYEGAALEIGAPVAGRLIECNQLIIDHPELLVSEPFGRGWIADIDHVAAESLTNLSSARRAMTHAQQDLRRLRRRIAFHLLSDHHEAGPPAACSGQPISDTGWLMSRAAYLELLRELIH